MRNGCKTTWVCCVARSERLVYDFGFRCACSFGMILAGCLGTREIGVDIMRSWLEEGRSSLTSRRWMNGSMNSFELRIEPLPAYDVLNKSLPERSRGIRPIYPRTVPDHYGSIAVR